MTDLTHLQSFIEDLHRKFKNNHEGEVATYIPELGKANPDDFGICLATVDGRVLSVGDCLHEFTIQSICKPFAFQMALEQLGREQVFSHVSVEPSGEAFNSIELEPTTKRPYNSMVNAGAIATASLIKGPSPEAGVKAFVEQMSRAAGRPLRIDEAVLASESATGNRNRAIAYMLLNWGIRRSPAHPAALQPAAFEPLLAGRELCGDDILGGRQRLAQTHGQRANGVARV